MRSTFYYDDIFRSSISNPVALCFGFGRRGVKTWKWASALPKSVRICALSGSVCTFGYNVRELNSLCRKYLREILKNQDIWLDNFTRSCENEWTVACTNQKFSKWKENFIYCFSFRGYEEVFLGTLFHVTPAIIQSYSSRKIFRHFVA